MKYCYALIIVTLTALFAGCASEPPHPRLDRARAEVQQAQANPLVTEYAASALAQAQDALARAQASLQQDQPEETDYLAYIAERRAQIAVANAREAKAKEKAQEADIARQQALQSETANAREQAASAQSAAVAAQQQAASAQTAAAAARQQAQAARKQAAAAQAQNQQAQSQLQLLKGKLSDLHPRQTANGIVLTLGDVLFGFNKADLKPSANPTLNELAEFLRNHPGSQIVINGYTDSVGSASYNQRLSAERAEAVASALERRGIDSSRMTTHGFGETDPIASNATQEGRAKNRRVEFVIKNIGNAQSP
ncbi:MAG TPA: OmpA family protein [Gammaproteobacteria bacterium]|nr:OmpA family protein [Gammaproteobacteria bacterium]